MARTKLAVNAAKRKPVVEGQLENLEITAH
jgi:hypothetical protein